MNHVKPQQKQYRNIPEDLRERNIRLILSQFMEYEELIVSDLERFVGISKTTIIKIIDRMVECGIILDIGKAEPSTKKGRRPNVFALNKTYRYIISVQIFPTEVYSVVTDLKNTILDSVSHPISQAIDFESLIQAVVVSVNGILAQNQIANDRVEALVIASSGPTNYFEGITIYAPRFPNLPRRMRIKEELGKRFPQLPNILVENEMRLQALAEQRLGISSSLNLVLEAGDKLVASLIDDKNTQIRGKHSSAGEIGHMVLDPHSTERCVCGSLGCFLALVSTSRVERMANSLLSEYPESVLHGRSVPIKISDVLCGFQVEDALCEFVLDDVARWFGQGIANIILMYDPETVTIQGIYTKAGPRFLEKIKKHVVLGKYPLINELQTQILYSHLGKDAGVLGGSIFATNQFLSTFKM